MSNLSRVVPNILRVWFMLCLCHSLLPTSAGDVTPDKCEISGPKSKTQQQLLDILEPLKGNVFTAKSTGEGEEYVYKVGICKAVINKPYVGALQQSKADKKDYILGYYNETQILGGSNWMMLIYTHGDNYTSHCGNKSRRMHLMLICDPDEEKGDLQYIEERRGESSDCFYLFELNTKVACTKEHIKEGLSGGSVFCILFFTLAGLYFILGFMYQRVVVGAKGLEQIPNYNFWKEFGELEADGCDFVCRCRSRYESHQYRGIDDRLPKDEESERDDQLLTM